MTRAFPELPGWAFEVEETSAGVYLATGRDALGRQVQTKGTDPDAVLAEVRGMAANVMAGAMTVNERLFAAGLMDDFDRAAKAGDVRSLRTILREVQLSDENIAAILKRVLPGRTT